MKLIVNSVMGSMMASFAEGLSLTDKAGLDPDTLLQVISLGAINTPMYALKGPNMIKGNFPPAFPLKHQQKDMRLALALGDELAQEMPVAAAANEMYKRRRAGKDDDDFLLSSLHRKEVRTTRETQTLSRPRAGASDDAMTNERTLVFVVTTSSPAHFDSDASHLTDGVQEGYSQGLLRDARRFRGQQPLTHDHLLVRLGRYQRHQRGHNRGHEPAR